MYSVTSGITNCDNSSSSLSQDDASFPHDDQRTLFVGNLSFFCKEEDLRVFFQQYSRIEYLRVLYNRRLRKSLMYGFVTLSTETEAANVLHLLDGHLFMGRKIKIAMAKDRLQKEVDVHPYTGSNSSASNEVKIRISFCSNFPSGNVILPTEEFLRGLFQAYARLVDVSLKSYHCHEQPWRQEGHGTLVFVSSADAMNVLQHFAGGKFVNGFKFTCTDPNAPPRNYHPRPQQYAAQPFEQHHYDNSERMIMHTQNSCVSIHPPKQTDYPMNPSSPVMHPPQTYQPQMPVMPITQMPMMPFIQFPYMPPFMLPPRPSAYQTPATGPIPSVPMHVGQLHGHPPISMNMPFPAIILPFGYYPQHSRLATAPANHSNAMNVYDCHYN